MKKRFLVLFILAMGNVSANVEFSLGSKKQAYMDEGILDTNNEKKQYKLVFDGQNVLTGKYFYISIESESLGTQLHIHGKSAQQQLKRRSLYQMGTYSGNILFIMNDTYHKGKLSFLKNQGILYFDIRNQGLIENAKYTLKVGISSTLDLPMGKSFSTRIDSSISELVIQFNYNGTQQPDLEKLKFQVISIRNKKDYGISATLSHKENTYNLNPVFDKMLGGVLTKEDHSLCYQEACTYQLNLQVFNIKALSLESFIVPKIQILSVSHYGDYYDKTYRNDQTSIYELPFDPLMDGQSVSILLIPVTAHTSLYVNAKTLQTNLSEYDWKAEGQLAKRLTISWQELVDIKAERSNFYIAVKTSLQGEYLLKVDTQENDIMGDLVQGVVEQSAVDTSQIHNYIFGHDVLETEEVNLEIAMTVLAGEAKLYFRVCGLYEDDCLITEEDIRGGKNLVKGEVNGGRQVVKSVSICNFNKNELASRCTYMVAIFNEGVGKAHYELVLRNSQQEHLMVPNHHSVISLFPEEKQYFKFSCPPLKKASKLELQIDPVWGKAIVYISKKQQRPQGGLDSLQYDIEAKSLGLNKSSKVVNITNEMFHEPVQGIYYLTIQAMSQCQINLVFMSKQHGRIVIHNLGIGQHKKGSIQSKDDMVYYDIKVNKNELYQRQHTRIILTPIRGQFVMYIGKEGKIPTREYYDTISQNNTYEITSEIIGSNDNVVVGVCSSSDQQTGGQFMMSVQSSSTVLNLIPGVIQQYYIKDQNVFLLEVINDMKSILILKSVIDGYSIDLCADFQQAVDDQKDQCQYKIDNYSVSLFLDQNVINTNCAFDGNKKCYIRMSLTGNSDHKYAIGFTYNDHPFTLTNDMTVTGPIPPSKYPIRFIYHGAKSEDIGIYFNNKGQRVSVFTKMSVDNAYEQNQAIFPTNANYDQEQTNNEGYITTIFYSKEQDNKQEACEILITVQGDDEQLNDFISTQHFILNAFTDAQEISRTSTLQQHLISEQWTYYTFYNNGDGKSVRAYVVTPQSSKLKVMLSQGIQSRPPFSNKALIQKSGIGNVDLTLNLSDLQLEQKKAETLQGHYTLAVKSSTDCDASIYWNNKDDFNYTEMTPGEPISMLLEEKRNFYFTFTPRGNEVSEKGDSIIIYLKTNSDAVIYITTTKGNITVPNESNYKWVKHTTGLNELADIIINPDDPNFCNDCRYMGSVYTQQDGQIDLQLSFRKHDMAVKLIPGFVFPERLEKNNSIMYKVNIKEGEQIDFYLTMLTGFVEVGVYDSKKAEEGKQLEQFNLYDTQEINLFLSLNTRKYDRSELKQVYIKVSNLKYTQVSYTVALQKNGIRIPIEPGIQKHTMLGPKEQNDYYYRPKTKMQSFYVRMTIKKILDKKLVQTCLDNINLFMILYYINDKGDKFPIKETEKSIHMNQLYIEFKYDQSKNSAFIIHVYNPIESTALLTLDLTSGDFKMINQGEYYTDYIKKKQKILYVGFGQQSKNLFIDLKICQGDLDFSAYENEKLKSSEKIVHDKISQAEVNKNKNYSYQLEAQKFFFKLKNKGDINAIYKLYVYSEKDVVNDPYSQISQMDDGKVSVDIDRHRVYFKPVYMNTTYGQNFKHKVIYKLYVSESKEAVTFAMNCGKFYLEKSQFGNTLVLETQVSILFNNDEEMKLQKSQNIFLELKELERAKKYYGIVIANIELMSSEEGILQPIKTVRTYYDDFVFITPKYKIPLNLIISVLITMCTLLCLYYIVKQYVFGDITKMKNFEKLTGLAQLDDDVLGLNVMNILEQQYYQDKIRDQQKQLKSEKLESVQSGVFDQTQELEMTESEQAKKPLDS